jgi:hypothetical protein
VQLSTAEKTAVSRYKLIDGGNAPFKLIMRGRASVGRVVRCADGAWLGVMYGKPRLEARGDTEVAAFEAVVSRHCGPDALRAHSAGWRAVR